MPSSMEPTTSCWQRHRGAGDRPAVFTCGVLTPYGPSLEAATHHDRGRPLIGFIIFMLVIGFVAGFLARLLVPGPDPMSLLQTWLLGVVGSFVGGFIGYLIFRSDGDDGWLQPAGFIGSVIGAVIALLVYRAVVRRSRRPVSRRAR